MENSTNGEASCNELQRINESVRIKNNNNRNYQTNPNQTTNLDEQLQNDQENAEPREQATVATEAMPFYMVIWTHLEQLKSILAGLLLLLCCGLHVVWAIFQFFLYKTSRRYEASLGAINSPVINNSYGFLLVTFSAWYLGIIIGCGLSGYYLLATLRKKFIYNVSASVMIVSSLLVFGANQSPVDWQLFILFGRLLAGISHGITYVTIFVHASENASKEFRHYLTTFIGGTISLSIFLTTFVICIPMPESSDEWIAKNSQLQSINVITGASGIFASVAIIVNYFYSHETFVFLFVNNYNDEVLITVAKLNHQDQQSPKLQADLIELKKMCTNDNGEYARWSLFAKSHKTFMAFALYARLAAVLSFNIFFVAFVVSIFEYFILTNCYQDVLEKDDSILPQDKIVLKHAVTIVISAWFVCGSGVTLIGSHFVWRRGIHGTTFVGGLIMSVISFLEFFDMAPIRLKTIIIVMMQIYFIYESMPVDIIGYMYIDCFPTTTKPYAVATVTIFENAIHILLIALSYNVDVMESFIYAVLLTTLGFKLFRTAPETRGLNLGEAQQAFIQASVGRKWWQL